MARLLGHRQTKGAVNRQTEPTATAPHLYSTGCRNRGRRIQWPVLAGLQPLKPETGFMNASGSFCYSD